MQETTLKALVVDDESRSRQLLQALLEEYCPEVEVCALAEDVPSAVKAIHKYQPQLVFLDIEMPGYTGFQLLDFFDEVDFEIVFTTAYREYALQAFQVSAIDYLLKPIQIEQLVKAVEKVKKQQHTQDSDQRLKTLQQNLQKEGQVTRIALPVADGFFFADANDIIYLSAERAYCNVFLADGQRLFISKHLKEFERLLTAPCFFRPHRSYLVNLNCVRRLVKKDGGYIEMDNGDIVSISRDRREAFIQAYQEWNT